MPCLSSRAVSDLKDSIRVSNAESQLAVPLTITTFFGSSVICSPNGSALWTDAAGGGGVAGACAADGGSAGDLVSAGGGTGAGVADGAGAGVAGVLAAGGAAGGGGCAGALPEASEIAAIGISASTVRRKEEKRFIQWSP